MILLGLLAVASAAADLPTRADSAAAAIEEFCLAAGPDFASSAKLVQRAGWVDPIKRARADLGEVLRDAPVIWRSPDGALFLSAGVALKSVSEPHTSCSVSSNTVSVDELISAAERRFGKPDAGRVAHWTLKGSRRRALIVTSQFGGEANNALAVVQFGNWSTAAQAAAKKSSK